MFGACVRYVFSVLVGIREISESSGMLAESREVGAAARPPLSMAAACGWAGKDTVVAWCTRSFKRLLVIRITIALHCAAATEILQTVQLDAVKRLHTCMLVGSWLLLGAHTYVRFRELGKRLWMFIGNFHYLEMAFCFAQCFFCRNPKGS